MIIDPLNITEYNAPIERLEVHILFWITAQGKNGVTSAKCLTKLLGKSVLPPFETIRFYGNELQDKLKECGIGCFKNKAKYMLNVANSNVNLQTCSVDELRAIKGIGYKTSKCFIMHTREGVKLAGLDRHVRNYLRDLGYDVPGRSLNDKEELKFQNIFLESVPEFFTEHQDWLVFEGSSIELAELGKMFVSAAKGNYAFTDDLTISLDTDGIPISPVVKYGIDIKITD